MFTVYINITIMYPKSWDPLLLSFLTFTISCCFRKLDEIRARASFTWLLYLRTIYILRQILWMEIVNYFIIWLKNIKTNLFCDMSWIYRVLGYMYIRYHLETDLFSNRIHCTYFMKSNDWFKLLSETNCLTYTCTYDSSMHVINPIYL